MYAINAAKTIVSITLQDGKGLLTLTKCDQGLGDVTKDSKSDIQNLIPAEVWGEYDEDITFDFELQLVARLTYEYTNPYEESFGECDDHGFLLRSAIDGAKYHHEDFIVPRGYVAYSGRLNDLNTLTDDQTDLNFDYYNLESLCGACYIYDETGNFQGLQGLIEYLSNSDNNGWYTGSFDQGLANSVTVNIHKPR
jgi:hypothetical protein